MVGQKDFDCVELKDRIQAQIREEYRGLTDEQRRERIRTALETSDDPVSRKWREWRRTTPSAAPRS